MLRQEGSSASAHGHGSQAFTDGQRPGVAGPGEGSLGWRPPMPIALGFGRLSGCLILMALFSGCHEVCLHFLSAGWLKECLEKQPDQILLGRSTEALGLECVMSREVEVMV